MNLNRASSRASLSSSIYRASRRRSHQPITSLFCSSGGPRLQNTFSGCPDSYKSNMSSGGNFRFSILGNLSQKLASLKVKENLSLPCALTFRRFIHSGDSKKAETGSISRPMDFVRGIIVEMVDLEDLNFLSTLLSRMLISCI